MVQDVTDDNAPKIDLGFGSMENVLFFFVSPDDTECLFSETRFIQATPRKCSNKFGIPLGLHYLWRNFLNKTEKTMAYKISSDLCIACGTCIDECPVEAISAGDVYVIDADSCIDCGACAGSCPSDAISAA
jgi:NAD-dependent dihydropyrimidine dehydrogenase PreA subunit